MTCLQEVCLRAQRPNRHGHTLEMPYPGPAGWTPEYAAARMESVAGRRACKKIKVLKGLEEMQRFTAMANWAKAAAADCGAEQIAAVDAVLASEVDAHRYQHVLGQIQAILKQEMPATLAI